MDKRRLFPSKDDGFCFIVASSYIQFLYSFQATPSRNLQESCHPFKRLFLRTFSLLPWSLSKHSERDSWHYILLQLYSSTQNTFNVNKTYGLLIGDAAVVSLLYTVSGKEHIWTYSFSGVTIKDSLTSCEIINQNSSSNRKVHCSSWWTF